MAGRAKEDDSLVHSKVINPVMVALVVAVLAAPCDSAYEEIRRFILTGEIHRLGLAVDALTVVAATVLMMLVLHFGPLQRVFIHSQQMKELRPVQTTSTVPSLRPSPFLSSASS